MRESRILQVNGIFLGAAAALAADTWRFIAAHEGTRALDGQEAPSVDALGRLAWQAYLQAPAEPV